MSSAGEVARLTPEERRALLAQLLRRKAEQETSTHALSQGQRALWFLHQLAPDSLDYNIGFAARIRSRVDVRALRLAFQDLVNRHAALRTTFAVNSGEPVQVVHGYTGVCFEEVDGSGLDDNLLRQQVLAAHQRPFDLEQGPLFRVSLFTRRAGSGEPERILLVSAHHIVSDGWSFKLLLRDLQHAYAAECAAGRGGGRPPLAAPEASYVQFVDWQRDMLAGPEGGRLRDYWHRQLGGVLPTVDLATDRPRPRRQTFNGSTLDLAIEPDLAQRVKALAVSAHTTLYTVLLAVLHTLLHRYTGQEDIIVGTPMLGRDQSARFTDTVGYFVNSVALRADLSGDPTFASFLEQVRRTALDAIAHQDYPFHLLVEQLQPERDPSRSPLFDVALNVQKFERAAAAPGALPLEAGFEALALDTIAIHQQEGLFDLTFDFYEADQALTGAIKYRRDLFDAATIARMGRHFLNLLAGAVANPALRLSELPILDDAERHQLLDTWNSTRADYPGHACIHDLVSAQAERTPDAVAAVFGDHTLSYRELDRRSNQVARYLNSLGVGEGMLVGVCIERSLDMLVGVLGILKSGAAYVPLDPAFPRERLAFMIEDARTPFVLTQQAQAPYLPLKHARAVCLDAEAGEIDRQPVAACRSGASPGRLAYIIYTSGSTGRPKGVEITHGAVVNFLCSMQREPGMTDRDVILNVTTLSFDIAGLELYLPLTTGARVALVSRQQAADPAELMKAISRYGATVLQATPVTWRMLIEAGWTGDQRLKILCGGETLSRELADRLLERGESAWNLYGPTETTTYSTAERLAPGQPVTVGRPIANTRVYILDEHGQPVPAGVPGNLHIGGLGVARGYLDRPELNREKFLTDPFCAEPGARMYRTDDLARFLPDGRIEHLGRLDDQVKVRGFRIEPGEVEAVLRRHPGVREAVVVAKPERAGGMRLVAYVIRSGAGQVESGELRAFLKQMLPDYMAPAAFVFVSAFPLTPNRKVDRRALPDPGETSPELPRADAAPGNETETALAGIWEDVLGIRGVGVADNFFDLGGHSLLAIQVVSRVQQVFGVEMPLRTLFEAPSLADLAARVDEAMRADVALHAPPLLPADRQAPLPLSFSQERMWFIHQLQPASSAYHVAPATRVKGRLDFGAFERSLAEVVRRHEDLRTVFTLVDGQPAQVVLPRVSAPARLVDLRETPQQEREQRLLSLAREEASRPFDLAVHPLLRMTVYRLGEDDYVVHNVMHHIVTDAWSMGVLMREVAALYNAHVSGGMAALPELEIQYGDFARWQRQWMQGDALEGQLAYWRRKLAGASVLELPADRPRPALQTTNGAIQSFDLADELLEALRRLGRAKGATLFMTALAAFDALLYRYTGQADVVVGIPVANRRWLAVENLIGTFVNTLALRTDLSGDPPFGELIERVRDVALEAFAHQDLSFAKLVAELPLARDTSHSPLFQTMFNVINVPVNAPDMAGLALSHYEIDSGGAQFDLSCTLTDVPGIHRVSISYNTDLFDAETIARFMRHYETLLRSIVANPDGRLNELTILPDDERRRMLREWNDTGADFQLDRCVHHLFEEQARRTPAAVAVEGQSLRARAWASVAYDDLDRQANQLAHHLRTLGVAPGTFVGLSLDRTTEMMIGLLAILKAGGAYVPLDPSFPSERLAFMLQDTRAPVLVTQRSLLAGLPRPQHDMVSVCLDDDWEAISREPASAPPGGATAGDLAYVLFTSGSTGKPKGVQIPHRALANFLLSMQSQPGLAAEDILLSVTTLSFDIAGLELYLPIISGARVAIASREMAADGALLARALRETGATVMQATPASWRLLIESGWTGTPGLKILCGGEALSRELAGQLLARGAAVWNLYGPTETTVWSTLERVVPGQSITVGKPIANTSVYVLDERRQPMPIGVPGNLHIGGAGVARGYLNRPELNAEKFLADPFSPEPGARMYRTDDLARFLPDGRIEHLGRLDHQVKVRGYRIELGEIESVLRQHPGVQDAVVIAREDRGGDKRLAAYVICRAGPGAPGPGADPAELRAFLKTQLPDYMLPSAFVFLDAFPLTPNQKVDRRALPEPAAPDAGRGHVPPRDDTEARLAQIWEDVLHVPQVGATDNFFDLGGHSLLAVRLFAEIERVFGKRLPLAMIFKHGTVEQIAVAIRERSAPEPWPSLVPIQPRGSRPPLFFVHPFGGDVIGFKVWADYLGDDQPFYGLRAQGLDGITEPLERIEDMAAHYIREMRAVQPWGPYYVGGYCAGGAIAFEMAQQLHAAGERVELVAIVNQAPPHSEYYTVTGRPGVFRDFLRNLPFWIDDFAHLEVKEMLARVRRVFARPSSPRAGENRQQRPEDTGRRYAQAFQRAWDRYAPAFYSGRIVVFRTERQPLICSFDPQLCWGGLAAEVQVRHTRGSNTTILRDPCAREVADHLRDCLDSRPRGMP